MHFSSPPSPSYSSSCFASDLHTVHARKLRAFLTLSLGRIVLNVKKELGTLNTECRSGHPLSVCTLRITWDINKYYRVDSPLKPLQLWMLESWIFMYSILTGQPWGVFAFGAAVLSLPAFHARFLCGRHPGRFWHTLPFSVCELFCVLEKIQKQKRRLGNW